MYNRFIWGVLISAILTILTVPAVTMAGYPPIIDLAGDSGVSTLSIYGEYETSLLGQRIAHGDFNNDGYTDMITGAAKGSPKERNNAGIAYIVWGSATLPEISELDLASPSDNVLEFYGDEIGEQLGLGVATGDINGDSIDDAIIGAWHKDGLDRFDCGAVYVYFGNDNLDESVSIDIRQTNDQLVTIYGPESGSVIFDDNPYSASITPGSEIGMRVDAGDINGDGYDDLLIGSWNTISVDLEDMGVCYVVLGGPTFGLNSVIDLAVEGESALTFISAPGAQGYSSKLGFAVAVNDIDNDGYEDIIMGDGFVDYQSHQDCGEIYIYWGNSTIGGDTTIVLGEYNPDLTVVHGSGHAEYLGNTVSAGDIDGDGYLDVLAGAYNASRGYLDRNGKVYVIFGSPDLRTLDEISVTDEQYVLSILGETTGGLFGKPSAGDINGDGIDDLIANADRQNSSDGKSFIIWGDPVLKELGAIDLSESNISKTVILGEYPNGNFGSYGCATDLNGDGYDDIICSSQNASVLGRTKSGVIHIIWGMPHTPGEISFDNYQVADTEGQTATIIIPSDISITGATLPEGGNEIGIFTSSGICAGQGVLDGEELTLTVYGDTGDESLVTGFLLGEIYKVRIWIPLLGKEYQTDVFFSSGPGYFQASSTTIIDTIVLTSGPTSSVGVENDNNVSPEPLAVMGANYPNPFNPRTAIPFELTSDSYVSISIYNILGEKVATLADEMFSAGNHEIVWDATGCASGMYICRLVSAGTMRTQRMSLVK